MHYSILVISKDPSDLERQLAPFDEHDRVEPYSEELTWMETPEQAREALQERLDKFAEWKANGRPGEDSAALGSSESHYCRWFTKIEAGQEPPLEDPTGMSDLEVMQAYHGEDAESIHINDEGKWCHMSTYNPDSKWDYWQIGGRYTGRFVSKDPNEGVLAERGWEWNPEYNGGEDHWPGNLPFNVCDQVQKKNVDWEAMGLMKMEQARKWWAEAIEARDRGDHEFRWSIVRDYATEEDYIKDSVRFSVYGYLDKDGNWVEQQNADYKLPDDERKAVNDRLMAEWRKALKKAIDSADDDDWFTVIDIHI